MKRIPFWKQVDKDGPVLSHCAELGPCWIWCGCRDTKTGYGRTTFNSKTYTASRMVWYLTYGAWPKGDACHRCDNPPCVNPAHLFDGTAKENSIDMVKKGRSAGKLTLLQVEEIKEKYNAGSTLALLAKEYKLNRTTVHRAVTSRTYKHLPILTGKLRKGTKLSMEEVTDIRRKCKEGATQQALAEEYELNQSTISRIVLEQVWKLNPTEAT